MFYHEGLSKTILRHFRKVYSIKKLMKILIQIWNEQIESKAIVDLNKGSSPNFATNIKKFKQLIIFYSLWNHLKFFAVLMNSGGIELNWNAESHLTLPVPIPNEEKKLS